MPPTETDDEPKRRNVDEVDNSDSNDSTSDSSRERFNPSAKAAEESAPEHKPTEGINWNKQLADADLAGRIAAGFKNGTMDIHGLNPKGDDYLYKDGAVNLAGLLGDKGGAKVATAGTVNLEPTRLPSTDGKPVVGSDGKPVPGGKAEPGTDGKGTDGKAAPGTDGKSADGKGTDGKGSEKTEGKEKPESPTEKQIREERDKLIARLEKEGFTAAEQRINKDSLDAILANKQYDKGKLIDRTPPLTDKQKLDYIKEFNRGLDQPLDPAFTKAERNNVLTAENYETAHPDKNNQGLRNNCNATVGMKLELYNNPDKQMGKLVDMLTNANGDHTVTMGDGKDMQKIQYDTKSLHPNKYEMAAIDQLAGQGINTSAQRFMSHLYVNDTTQRRATPEFYTYERSKGDNDSGERRHIGSWDGKVATRDEPVKDREGNVLTMNGKPVTKKVIDDSPAMGAQDVANMIQRLEGANKDGKVAMLTDLAHFGAAGAKNIHNVESVNGLNSAWEKNGGKPMVLAVDTRAAMFRQPGEVGGAGGGHVIVVSDRREVTGADGKKHFEYNVRNNWGDGFNGWVSDKALTSTLNPTKGDYSALPQKGEKGWKADQPENGGSYDPNYTGPRGRDGIIGMDRTAQIPDAKKQDDKKDDKSAYKDDEKRNREREEEKLAQLDRDRRREDSERNEKLLAEAREKAKKQRGIVV